MHPTHVVTVALRLSRNVTSGTAHARHGQRHPAGYCGDRSGLRTRAGSLFNASDMRRGPCSRVRTSSVASGLGLGWLTGRVSPRPCWSGRCSDRRALSPCARRRLRRTQRPIHGAVRAPGGGGWPDRRPGLPGLRRRSRHRGGARETPSVNLRLKRRALWFSCGWCGRAGRLVAVVGCIGRSP